MTIRVGINGFGRIGRMVLRAGWGRPGLEFVHINDLSTPDMLAYLLRRDSVHGTWNRDVQPVEGGISIDGKHVKISAEKEPANLKWTDIDVVLECTGKFTDGKKARAHLDGGARKVLISA